MASGNRKEQAYCEIKGRILSGHYRPGEIFSESAMVADLGISRTPIREAIRKLELEGLVLMIPRRGAEVAEITEQNLRDVLEVREALEELSVKLACEHATQAQIEEMKQAAQVFKESLSGDDVTRIAEADVAFHDAINMATDNQKLIQILNNLREQMYRYRVEYLKNNEVYEQLLEEHEFLIQAVIKHDKAQAKDIICRHIDNQEKAIAEFIRNKKNGRV